MRLRVFLRGIRWEKRHQNRQLKWSPCERNLGSELDFPSTQGPFLGYFKGKIEVQDLFFSGWRHRRVERFSFLRVSRDFLRVFLRGKRRPRVFLRVIPWEKRHQNRQWSSGGFFYRFLFLFLFFSVLSSFVFLPGSFFFYFGYRVSDRMGFGFLCAGNSGNNNSCNNNNNSHIVNKTVIQGKWYKKRNGTHTHTHTLHTLHTHTHTHWNEIKSATAKRSVLHINLISFYCSFFPTIFYYSLFFKNKFGFVVVDGLFRVFFFWRFGFRKKKQIFFWKIETTVRNEAKTTAHLKFNSIFSKIFYRWLPCSFGFLRRFDWITVWKKKPKEKYCELENFLGSLRFELKSIKSFIIDS